MLELQYLRHAFFRLRFNNTTVLTDPFMNNSLDDQNLKPLFKCPVSEKDLGKVDLILLSQENFDHFDVKAVESLCAKHRVTVVGHESVIQQLNVPQNQKKPIMSGNKFTLLGIDIEVLPAHFPKSYYPVSYLLSDRKSSIFFAADTALTDSLNTVKADIALLPIGGNETMDVVDAVRATKTIKPLYSIPMHYDTFESIKADPNEFKQKIEKSILKTVPVILRPGEKFSF